MCRKAWFVLENRKDANIDGHVADCNDDEDNEAGVVQLPKDWKVIRDRVLRYMGAEKPRMASIEKLMRLHDDTITKESDKKETDKKEQDKKEQDIEEEGEITEAQTPESVVVVSQGEGDLGKSRLEFKWC